MNKKQKKDKIDLKRTFRRDASLLAGEERISVFRDKFFWIFSSVWLSSLVLISLYVSLKFSGLPQQIPLFYSRIWGEKQLAPVILVFLPMTGAFFLGGLDLISAYLLYSKDRVYSYFLLGTASLVSLLVTITVFNIVNLL